MLTDVAQTNENGDIYYLMSRIFESNEDYKSAKDCLELALGYKNSLTFDMRIIQKELENLKNLTTD